MLQTLIKIQHLAEETSRQSVYGAYGLHPRGKKGYCLSCCLVSGPKSDVLRREALALNDNKGATVGI